MKGWVVRLAVAGLLGGLPSLALSQGRREQERVVPSGRSQKIQSIIAIDAGCRALSLGPSALIDPPTLGRVTLEPTREYPSYSAGNPRSWCNSRKVPATQLIYTTDPGTVGEDRFAIEYVGPYGIPVRQRFHVVVR